MGGLYFFGDGGMSECQSKESNTEVSRSHSSEECFVMKQERRTESLKQVSFFLEVVKAKEVEKQTGKKSVVFPDEPAGSGRTRKRQPPFCRGSTRKVRPKRKGKS